MLKHYLNFKYIFWFLITLPAYIRYLSIFVWLKLEVFLKRHIKIEHYYLNNTKYSINIQFEIKESTKKSNSFKSILWFIRFFRFKWPKMLLFIVEISRNFIFNHLRYLRLLELYSQWLLAYLKQQFLVQT